MNKLFFFDYLVILSRYVKLKHESVHYSFILFGISLILRTK